MNKRGRKSRDDLAVVHQVPGQRPEPPTGFNNDEAEEWRAVVSRMPADWFGREMHGLLESYVKHVVTARRVAKAITKVKHNDLETDEGIKRLDKLSAIHAREVGSARQLATAMRITQQAQYSKDKAGGEARDAGAASKPWEVHANEG